MVSVGVLLGVADCLGHDCGDLLERLFVGERMLDEVDNDRRPISWSIGHERLGMFKQATGLLRPELRDGGAHLVDEARDGLAQRDQVFPRLPAPDRPGES